MHQSIHSDKYTQWLKKKIFLKKFIADKYTHHNVRVFWRWVSLHLGFWISKFSDIFKFWKICIHQIAYVGNRIQVEIQGSIVSYTHHMRLNFQNILKTLWFVCNIMWNQLWHLPNVASCHRSKSSGFGGFSSPGLGMILSYTHTVFIFLLASSS